MEIKAKNKLEISFFNHSTQLFYVGTEEQIAQYYKDGVTKGLIKFKSGITAAKYIDLNSISSK